MLLRTVLVHGCLETLVESAGSTLVAVCLVDRTASLQVAGCFARVYSITVNTSLEEPRTTYKILSELYSSFDARKYEGEFAAMIVICIRKYRDIGYFVQDVYAM